MLIGCGVWVGVAVTVGVCVTVGELVGVRVADGLGVEDGAICTAGLPPVSGNVAGSSVLPVEQAESIASSENKRIQ
jgi:hypothetical protein